MLIGLSQIFLKKTLITPLIEADEIPPFGLSLMYMKSSILDQRIWDKSLLLVGTSWRTLWELDGNHVGTHWE